MVRVKDSRGRFIQARALLDTCSTANFITERFAKSLNLKMQPCSIPVEMMNATTTISKYSIQITFYSMHGQFKKSVRLLTVPSIAESVPAEVFPRDSIAIPQNFRLADPQFHIPRPVDILIGSGATLSMLSIGQINLSNNQHDLYLQKTQLGWVVAGGTDVTLSSETKQQCHFVDLTKAITKFWEIEEIEVSKPHSFEELECEKHYLENTRRDGTGRYIVRLPFRKATSLGESRTMALRRFHALEKKLDSDPSLKTEYSSVMHEYITLGHMSLVNHVENDGYFLPHHAVIKTSSSTTKVRVVFDASAKTQNGKSLNDTLMVGPIIQDKIFEHLIRFRSHRYVMTADIEKMYRQILVDECDRKFQQILWRVDGKIQTFQLNTVTFGVSSAPFLAIRTLHKLADDEKANFPRAVSIIKRDVYVDDLLTGAESLRSLGLLRDEIISLLKSGGFNIRQWASNDKSILTDLPETSINSKLILDKTSNLKTLGVTWNSENDKISYTVCSITIGEKVTKRLILSEIAKIYDPLGLLGPVVLYAKIIMQDVWKSKVGWDESVPSSLYSKWLAFAQQLNLIKDLTIDRYLFIPNYYKSIQIHGFCDASEKGYGACLYARSCDVNGKVECRLICAKSRVASLKSVTIPRLELCGALTLARLFKETQDAFKCPALEKVVFWTDSTITLHWLQSSPNLLKTFVAHRVAEVQEKTSIENWRHVRSKDNPADALSRGQSPAEFLQNQLWFQGPSWLRESEDKWPIGIQELKTELPDLKKVTCFILKVPDNNFYTNFSSYSRLLHISAQCLRAFRSTPYKGLITISEKREAEIGIIKAIQASQFAQEISLIDNNPKSKLANLNPFVDDRGVLRVGGRLRHANVSEARKYPILLPTHHHVTDLIIRDVHENVYHAGIQMTLNTVRQRFWLLNGRNQVRHIIKHCNRCFKFKAEAANYKMADLPAVRVRGVRPFNDTGVDYCGPLYIKEKKFRNRNKVKIWICIFICLATKAVHIEVVSDMTTEAFLGALRRFIARRGVPATMHSDNGTNFVGASNVLKELFVLIESDEFKQQVYDFTLKKQIDWHFNPPLAPHFGGIWEAAVKSFKHHFRRVIGHTLFTFEEINTFAIEIEAILNSRPICSISSDPNDLQALTPAHFLMGQPLTLLPEDNFLYVPDNRLSSWKMIMKARQDLWRRWHDEYLNELQVRQKWTEKHSNLKAGTIVLIKDKNIPCTRWSLGRIIEAIPSDDGVVRKAIVQTCDSVLERCVRLLCPLPSQ